MRSAINHSLPLTVAAVSHELSSVTKGVGRIVNPQQRVPLSFVETSLFNCNMASSVINTLSRFWQLPVIGLADRWILGAAFGLFHTLLQLPVFQLPILLVVGCACIIKYVYPG